MRQSALLRFLVIGVLVALGLGLASFYALRELNESSTGDVRRNMILFFAQAVESGGPYQEAVQTLRSRSGRRYSGTNLWVYSGQGDLLANSGEITPPVAWSDLKKPAEIHDFAFHYHFLRLIPDLALVKLDTKEDTYLLIEFRRPGSFRGAAWVQIAFVFFIVAVSVLIAVALTYVYLRKKSDEARKVLSRLEKGDLKARFEIKRLDEIGSLMGDFNRMASEIERLVHRVQETEMARKNLLEELSHDLRTPLTSLNTSVDTLCEHWDDMPRQEQREFVSVIQTELGYFLHLIEDLFFIASIGEPRYKKTTRKVDLLELLANEVKGREKTAGSRQGPPLSWSVICDEPLKPEAFVLGDPLLIQRLFRNALDNAAKHAATYVKVRIMPLEQSVGILIEDDGSGITDEAVARFGQWRKNRFQVSESGQGVSLGLGSVIMRTILELHGGTFTIRRKDQGGAAGAGTQLSLLLPKNLSEKRVEEEAS